jgi:hypothetical protein
MQFWSLIAWWWLYPLALTVLLCFYLGLVLLLVRRPRVAHGSAIARLAAPPVAPQGVPHQVSPRSPAHPADATSCGGVPVAGSRPAACRAPASRRR